MGFRNMLKLICACFVLLFPIFLLAEDTPVDEGTTEVADESVHIEKDIELSRERIQLLVAREKMASGEDRVIIQQELIEEKLEIADRVLELAKYLIKKEVNFEPDSALRSDVEVRIRALNVALVDHIDESELKAAELRNSRPEVEIGKLMTLEREISSQSRWTSNLFQKWTNSLGVMRQLNMESAAIESNLSRRLKVRADLLAGYIKLEYGQRDHAERRVNENPDDVDLKTRLRAIRLRSSAVLEEMYDIVGYLDQVGSDTTKYRSMIIKSTGEVSVDLFNLQVFQTLAGDWLIGIKNWILGNGASLFVKLLAFVAVLLVFRLIATGSRFLLEKSFEAQHISTSQLVREMMFSVANRGIMVVGLLVALSQVGIEIAPLLTGLGIAGFIIGFALQDTLSNFAAGGMILGYRPFDIGDFIETDGVRGVVNNMSLVSTTILTFDNQTLIIPNAKIWGGVIKNITLQTERRVDMEFSTAYGDDTEKTLSVLRSIVDENPLVLETPEALIKLNKLGDYALEFAVRPWVRTNDYWEVYWDITAEVKKRFDQEGITIPFPLQQIEMLDP